MEWEIYQQKEWLSSCLGFNCRTKEEGGLGIINMKNLNTTLLLKFLDKFYNQADIPWFKFTWGKLYNNNDTLAHVRRPIGFFWWKDISKLIDKFLQMTHCQPNRGNSLMFWADNWLPATLQNTYPQLYSYAKRQKCSIRYFLEHDLSRLFHLPLSIQASSQLVDLQTLLEERLEHRGK